MYHWEADQEDFLVLAGEALLIVEGDERPLRQWDFVHCPPGANHVIVGAGEGLCGTRSRRARPLHRLGVGCLTVDEAALRHGAGVEQETTDSKEAYARFLAAAGAVPPGLAAPVALVERCQVLLQAATLRERLEGAGVGHVGVGDVEKAVAIRVAASRAETPSWLTAKSERIELPELASSWRSPESSPLYPTRGC